MKKEAISTRIPTGLSDQVRALQAGEKNRRKRFNDLYQPHVPLKELLVTRKRDMSDSSDYSDSYSRESCLNRCVLFFVLLTSVTALILVVLMMLGKVGPAVEGCACVNTEQGSYNKKGLYNLLFTKSHAVGVLQSIHEYFSCVILKKCSLYYHLVRVLNNVFRESDHTTPWFDE